MDLKGQAEEEAMGTWRCTSMLSNFLHVGKVHIQALQKLHQEKANFSPKGEIWHLATRHRHFEHPCLHGIR